MYKNTEIAAFAAYLVGVPNIQLTVLYGEEYNALFNVMDKLDATNVIRMLCRLRTKLLRNFLKTDKCLQQKKSFVCMTWFDIREIKRLATLGFDIKGYATSSVNLLTYINTRIDDIIDNCQEYLPDSIVWEYFRSLFIYADYMDDRVQKTEFENYKQYQELYPYRMYIHWKPVDCGNWFENDKLFLQTIYAQNEDSIDNYSNIYSNYESIADKVEFTLCGFSRLMCSLN